MSKDSKNGNECLPLRSAKKESSAVKSSRQTEATPTRVTRARKVSENEENSVVQIKNENKENIIYYLSDNENNNIEND